MSSGYSGPGRLIDSTLYTKHNNLRYTAGIIVDPSFVGHNPYEKNPHHGLRVDPDWVFDVAYMKGIHGFNRTNVIGRKDNWKPGYLRDSDIAAKIFKAGGMVDQKTFEKIKTDFNKFYDVRKHTPTNSTPPDKMMRRDYKNICKSVGLKIDKEMGSFMSSL